MAGPSPQTTILGDMNNKRADLHARKNHLRINNDNDSNNDDDDDN